ncbi:MAG: hypothetical protein LAT79_03810 [Kiritimatiellae bacterium]|nr:hypothetical protein [Kiritimatiellia bacterium]
MTDSRGRLSADTYNPPRADWKEKKAGFGKSGLFYTSSKSRKPLFFPIPRFSAQKFPDKKQKTKENLNP